MAATGAQGSLLKIESATPGTFNTVPGVTKFDIPNATREYNEATSHDSTGGYKEWSPGLLDGGEKSAEFLFDPTNVIHQQLITNANSVPGTLKNFKAVLPTATFHDWTWAAYVSLEGPIEEKGKLMLATLKYRVTGPVTPPAS